MANDNVKKDAPISPIQALTLAALQRQNKETTSPTPTNSEKTEQMISKTVEEQKNTIKSRTETIKADNGVNSQNAIYDLDPKSIKPWGYADRKESDFGDMEWLISSIQNSGQVNPVIVRKLSRPEGHILYELIAGHRRLRACLELDKPIKAIIKNISDSEAYSMMVSENGPREGISAFSMALSYKKALDNKLFKNARSLSLSLGKDAQYVKHYLVYFNIPTNVFNAIGDFSKVGLNTARQILSACTTKEGCQIIIDHASQIRTGKITTTGIKRIISADNRSPKTFKGKGGDYLTFRKDSNGTPVISILSEGRKIADIDTLIKRFIDVMDELYISK